MTGTPAWSDPSWTPLIPPSLRIGGRKKRNAAEEWREERQTMSQACPECCLHSLRLPGILGYSLSRRCHNEPLCEPLCKPPPPPKAETRTQLRSLTGRQQRGDTDPFPCQCRGFYSPARLRSNRKQWAGLMDDTFGESSWSAEWRAMALPPTLQWNEKGLTYCGFGAEKEQAACSVAVKLMDLDPQGRWFDPWSGQDQICTAVGPLSKALNATLLQGVCPAQSNQL